MSSEKMAIITTEPVRQPPAHTKPQIYRFVEISIERTDRIGHGHPNSMKYKLFMKRSTPNGTAVLDRTNGQPPKVKPAARQAIVSSLRSAQAPSPRQLQKLLR